MTFKHLVFHFLQTLLPPTFYLLNLLIPSSHDTLFSHQKIAFIENLNLFALLYLLILAEFDKLMWDLCYLI